MKSHSNTTLTGESISVVGLSVFMSSSKSFIFYLIFFISSSLLFNSLLYLQIASLRLFIPLVIPVALTFTHADWSFVPFNRSDQGSLPYFRDVMCRVILIFQVLYWKHIFLHILEWHLPFSQLVSPCDIIWSTYMANFSIQFWLMIFQLMTNSCFTS